jgi:hypothetical protein
MTIDLIHTLGRAATILLVVWLAAGVIIEVFFGGECNDRPDLD